MMLEHAKAFSYKPLHAKGLNLMPSFIETISSGLSFVVCWAGHSLGLRGSRA